MVQAERYGLKKDVVDAILQLAKKHKMKRIIVFGSRARGDYKERSDIDLAVFGGETIKFSIEIEESVPTLLKFDIIDMEKPVQKELVEAINKEGVVLYEEV